MWNFLEKIRQKPEPQKKLIALISAFVITVIIILIWLPTVFSEKKIETVKQEVVKERDPISEVTPIANLGSQLAEIKSMWGEVTSQFKKKEVNIQNNNSTTTLEIESSVQ